MQDKNENKRNRNYTVKEETDEEKNNLSIKNVKKRVKINSKKLN